MRKSYVFNLELIPVEEEGKTKIEKMFFLNVSFHFRQMTTSQRRNELLAVAFFLLARLVIHTVWVWLRLQTGFLPKMTQLSNLAFESLLKDRIFSSKTIPKTMYVECSVR